MSTTYLLDLLTGGEGGGDSFQDSDNSLYCSGDAPSNGILEGGGAPGSDEYKAMVSSLLGGDITVLPAIEAVHTTHTPSNPGGYFSFHAPLNLTPINPVSTRNGTNPTATSDQAEADDLMSLLLYGAAAENQSTSLSSANNTKDENLNYSLLDDSSTDQNSFAVLGGGNTSFDSSAVDISASFYFSTGVEGSAIVNENTYQQTHTPSIEIEEHSEQEEAMVRSREIPLGKGKSSPASSSPVIARTVPGSVEVISVEDVSSKPIKQERDESDIASSTEHNISELRKENSASPPQSQDSLSSRDNMSSNSMHLSKTETSSARVSSDNIRNNNPTSSNDSHVNSNDTVNNNNSNANTDKNNLVDSITTEKERAQEQWRSRRAESTTGKPFDIKTPHPHTAHDLPLLHRPATQSASTRQITRTAHARQPHGFNAPHASSTLSYTPLFNPHYFYNPYYFNYAYVHPYAYQQYYHIKPYFSTAARFAQARTPRVVVRQPILTPSPRVDASYTQESLETVLKKLNDQEDAISQLTSRVLNVEQNFPKLFEQLLETKTNGLMVELDKIFLKYSKETVLYKMRAANLEKLTTSLQHENDSLKALISQQAYQLNYMMHTITARSDLLK